MGGSSDLCALLKPGEPVILMGPTGTPTETPAKETVLLIGGGLGNAVLFSIGQQTSREWIAHRSISRDIRRSSIATKWKKSRRRPMSWSGAAMKHPVYARPRAGQSFRRKYRGRHARLRTGRSGRTPRSRCNAVDRLVVIGSDAMMGAVRARGIRFLAPFLKPDHKAIGSINSPMQCMMKEICAQCLQLHKDPVTGEETVVFSCFNQDQSLDHVDWSNLRTRLSQNGVQEKLTKQWIDRCLRQIGAREELVAQ